MRFLRKRKRKLISTTCRNCSTQTHGRYCHVCGQDIFAGRESSVWRIIYSLLENAFAFDSKIPKTYYYLLFRPGFLSLEYIRGRIVRYIAPTKLLWFIVIIFFALTISQNSITFNNKRQKEQTKSSIEQISPLEEEEFAKEKDTDNINKDIVSQSVNSIIKDREQFAKIFIASLPYLAFISIPFFAFLMYIFFRNRRRLFVNSLIFSTHLYAALFLLMLIYYLVNLTIPNDFYFHGLVYLILVLIPFVYYFWAIRVFYKSRYIGVIIKGGIVLFLSLVAMAFILVIFLLLIAFFMKVTAKA